MLEPFDVASPAILAFGVFSGAFVSGFAGFGLAAAAGAVLLHVYEPATAIPLMMVCSVLSQTASLVALRKAIDWRSSLPFVAGGLIGVPLALAVFHRIDAATFRAGFGLFLVVYAGQALVLAGLSRRAVPVAHDGAAESVDCNAPTRPMLGRGLLPIVGLGAGFVGGLTAMPGALLSVWCDLQARTKENRRGVIQPFILVMQVAALAGLAFDGTLLSASLAGATLLSLPFVAAGTALGLVLFGRVDSGSFRLAVLVIVFVSGLGMLGR